ncbi:hypothetical protein HGA92_04135 [Candidatus Gracilibacteria bacterium]|nr:hypothetical protein [Candidatus Gracilibacteria bacterium]NUJ98576.1 hypothetical protein [Candidatus Gracilibacteria bacterium]
MKKLTKKAFTLAEMMISIGIFMLLMVSISIFVTEGVKNITFQKKILDSGVKELSFFKKLQDFVNDAKKNNLLKTFSSGALLKMEKSLFSGGFFYLGEASFSGKVCGADSPHQETNNLILVSFLPFEGQGGDLFGTGKNFSFSGIEIDYFNASIAYSGTSLTGNIIGPTNALFTGSTLYIADTKGNQILEFDTNNITQPGIKIVGTGEAGNTIISGQNGEDVYLNQPTGMALIGENLFISDSLNDRILQYNILTKKVYSYFSSQDGLVEPTGLYYDNTEKRLYIVNSGKGEILKIDAQNVTVPIAPKFLFSINPSITINKIFLSFFSASGAGVNLASPTNTGGISFSGITQEEDFERINGNMIEYYFSNYTNPETSQTGCTSGNYILASGNPIKCTDTGIGIIGTLQNKILSGNNYSINVSNLIGNFSTTGSYYTKISFFSGVTEIYTLYKPYFTNGDDNIMTIGDNTSSVFASSFSYPTGIYKVGSNIITNDFFSRTKYVLDENSGNIDSTGSLSSFNFSFFKDYPYKYFLKNPIKTFSFTYIGNLVSVYLEYYKNFSCYDDEKNLIKSFLFKKYIGN